MAKTVRTETRKRGIVGQIFKWAFIAFNVVMLIVVLRYLGGVGTAMDEAGSPGERLGIALWARGAGRSIGGIWLLGALVLGLAAWLTRGPKVVTEERVE